MRTRRQALGQHFLHDQQTIEKIIALTEKEISHAQNPPKILLEIGPGRLALTQKLYELSQNNKIPLVLVERDKSLEPILSDFQKKEGVEVYFMDAATETFEEWIKQLAQQRQASIFIASNLPYSASSQILARLCHQSEYLKGCIVMVQKELANRMAAPAQTSARGAFSLFIQSYFEVNPVFDVSPNAFSPPPQVTSTVITLKPLSKPLVASIKFPLKFEQFCKKLFSQRRKMIRNTIPKEKHDLFAKLDISGTERPEVLKLETIIELYRGCEEGAAI